MNFVTCLALVFFALASSLLGCQESSQQTVQESAQQSSAVVPPQKAPETLAALISADQLAELLKAESAKVRILAPGRELADFESGHLPGARFLDWVEDMTDAEEATYKNPPKAQFAAMMSELGIQNDDHIVIYDRLANRLSTRLFWTLKYFGHEKVQVLDGGFAAWKSKHELSTEIVEAPASEYQIDELDSDILAELSFVEQRIAAKDALLIDGRPADQYSGKAPGKVFHTLEEHPRRGHIPGAVNVFWQDNFNEDTTFKSVEELKELYKNAGVKPDQCVVTYCNEGLHAAPPWFVLTQLLGHKNVRLYDSSMAEWAKTKNPMEKSVAE